MSVPNPFSTSNAPHHNLVPKVVGGSGGKAFEVAVDLVDIDSAYVRQLGSTFAKVQDIYLGGTFYWSGATFSPPLPSGGGGTGPQVQVVGGTGITASSFGPITTVTNTGVVGIRPGFGISVVPVLGAYQEYEIKYVGGTTGAGPAGPTGATGPDIIGPNTQILYYGPSGITSNSRLTYDGALNTPAIDVGTSSLVKIKSTNGDSIIESGLADFPGSGNLLKIGEIGGTGTVIIDTNQSFVGINRNPRVALDVSGQTILTYGVTGTTYSVNVSGSVNSGYALAPNTTYFIQGWGAGGASNGGVGGAGGFAGLTLTTSSAATQGISWSNQYGGTGGGGNALVVYYNGAELLYVPGGGAGNTGATGAAAGEARGTPIPQGGFSAGYTGTSVAIYNNTTPWLYNTLADISVTGGTFTNGTIYNIAGNATSGMTLTFSPPAPVQATITGVGTTFTTYPGTTFTIQASSLRFFNSIITSTEDRFVLPNGFAPIVDIGVTGLSGSTGTASYSNWPGVTYPTFNGNPALFGDIGLTGAASTVTTGPFNLTFVAGSTYSWFFAGTVDEATPNAIIGITAGTTFSFTVPSLQLTGVTMTTSGNIVIPTGTDIRVGQRIFTNRGLTATNQNGVNNGGGGYIGGGSSALVRGIPGIPDSAVIGSTFNLPAGGGAGSWYIAPTYAGVTLGGSGINPYTNQFNNYAQYGYGGTTGAGGPAFLVLQTATAGASTPALTVNGNEVVNGNNTVNGNEVVNGNLRVTGGVQVDSGTVGLSVGAGSAYISSRPSIPDVLVNVDGIASLSVGKTVVSALVPLTAPSATITGNVQAGSFNNQITTPAGKVRIATADGSLPPGVFTLDSVTGGQGATLNVPLTVGGTARADDFIATSDVRTKNSIVTVDSALDKVMKMRGVFFERNDEPGERRVGVIAQEIEEILPEVVHTDKDGMKSVSYGSIIGLLIEAIKEQQEIIEKFQV